MKADQVLNPLVFSTAAQKKNRISQKKKNIFFFRETMRGRGESILTPWEGGKGLGVGGKRRNGVEVLKWRMGNRSISVVLRGKKNSGNNAKTRVGQKRLLRKKDSVYWEIQCYDIRKKYGKGKRKLILKGEKCRKHKNVKLKQKKITNHLQHLLKTLTIRSFFIFSFHTRYASNLKSVKFTLWKRSLPHNFPNRDNR